tara:strand:- start:165 stop:326 length:162 start_codon:yes stop_codon:yes gene_type:complete
MTKPRLDITLDRRTLELVREKAEQEGKSKSEVIDEILQSKLTLNGFLRGVEDE